MSRRSSDSPLVVDLDGVLRIWDPEIVSSAERRAGLPRGALDRAALADAATLRAAVSGRISDAHWRAGIAARLVAVHGRPPSAPAHRRRRGPRMDACPLPPRPLASHAA
jgi:hypothetical protein